MCVYTNFGDVGPETISDRDDMMLSHMCCDGEVLCATSSEKQTGATTRVYYNNYYCVYGQREKRQQLMARSKNMNKIVVCTHSNTYYPYVAVCST